MGGDLVRGPLEDCQTGSLRPVHSASQIEV